MNKIFHKRLKTLRKQRGKTQDDIAKILKIKRTTYGEYERGKITPPAAKIQLLSEYFNVSIDYLLGANEGEEGENNLIDSENLDVSKVFNVVISQLNNYQKKPTFDGEILNDETKELLLASIENSLKIAKISQKVKGEK